MGDSSYIKSMGTSGFFSSNDSRFDIYMCAQNHPVISGMCEFLFQRKPQCFFLNFYRYLIHPVGKFFRPQSTASNTNIHT